jgi:hypothetical protein
MASWGREPLETELPVRRVRDEVKDGVAVVAMSAIVSTLVAVGFTVLMKLVG